MHGLSIFPEQRYNLSWRCNFSTIPVGSTTAAMPDKLSLRVYQDRSACRMASKFANLWPINSINWDSGHLFSNWVTTQFCKMLSILALPLCISSFKHTITGRAGYSMIKTVGLLMAESFLGVVSCFLALSFKPWHIKTHKTGEKERVFKNILFKYMLESVENLTTLK